MKIFLSSRRKIWLPRTLLYYETCATRALKQADKKEGKNSAYVYAFLPPFTVVFIFPKYRFACLAEQKAFSSMVSQRNLNYRSIAYLNFPSYENLLAEVSIIRNNELSHRISRAKYRRGRASSIKASSTNETAQCPVEFVPVSMNTAQQWANGTTIPRTNSKAFLFTEARVAIFLSERKSKLLAVGKRVSLRREYVKADIFRGHYFNGARCRCLVQTNVSTRNKCLLIDLLGMSWQR